MKKSTSIRNWGNFFFRPGKEYGQYKLGTHADVNAGYIYIYIKDTFFLSTQPSNIVTMANKINKKYFRCSKCTYTSIRKSDVTRHIKLTHKNFKHQCEECQLKTKRRQNLIEHMKKHNSGSISNFSCRICKLQFTSKNIFEQHILDSHKVQNNFVLRENAYSRNLQVDAADPSCLSMIKPEFVNLCQQILVHDYPIFKLNIIM